MDKPQITQAMINAYDEYTHLTLDRRRFMERLTALAGSGAAAAAIAPLLAANSASAEIIASDDQRLAAKDVVYGGSSGEMKGYLVRPKEATGQFGTVIVIHENRGLNPHTRDVARRMALEGFIALAPDFLSPSGGTPDNEDQAREMIGKLDIAATTRDAQSAFTRFAAERKAGVVGFCWGGAMVDRLAVAGAHNLAAAVSYYGPAPAPEEAAKVKVPLMLQLAGLDTRVAQTAHPFAEALKAAGKPVIVHDYPDVNHAFNNDSSAERYNADAAKLAWDRTIAFFDRLLKG